MKQRVYGLFAVLMAVLLAVGVSAAAGMYTYSPSDDEYWSPDSSMLDKTAVSLWLETGKAAGYNVPSYPDATEVSYLEDMESGWYEVVLCGLGSYADDFPEDVDGKIALCIRGDSTFTVKTENAKNAGAVACLVGNNCRKVEKINENGIVMSRTYENITMSMDYYTVPAVSLSSDVTVRLVAATADVSIAEAVAAVTEIYNGSLELGLEHQQTARVFLGTAEEYRKTGITQTTAGMYTYNPSDGEYWSADHTMLDKTKVSLWMEDGTAAGYNTPHYFDETGITYLSYLSQMEPGWYEVVLCGLGSYAEDFSTDVKGKIALCIRGDSTFVVKAKNAKNAGAVACLVGNNCRAEEAMDENGIVMSGTYANITMNMDYYTIPSASLSSDVTVRLVAETADVTIAEAVAAVTEIYNGSLELSLTHKQTARVFIGTEKEYWTSYGTEENAWHTYRNLQWMFDETTGVLSITGEGAVPDTYGNQCPWNTYSSKILTVVIGEGITELPWRAISSFGYNFTEICLPATLTAMDAYQLGGLYNLKTITVAADNERYYVKDGVLFGTADDGIHLLVYPQTKKDLTSYTVPEGVTRLGKRAFTSNWTLTKLILPESLEVIEELALHLYKITTLHIPANVNNFSPVGIFCNSLTEYTIDSANQTYTVVDGILYSKDMTVLNAYPALHPGTSYTIPDSVTTIPNSLFLKTSNIETLTIPASVTKIIDANGYALSECSMEQIEVDAENPKYRSVDGVLYSKDMTTLIFYPPCKEDTVYRMPDTVTSVRSSAFGKLVYLKELHFSPGITDWSSHSNIFGSTPALTSVYFYGAYSPTISAPFMSLYMGGQISNITFYYIEGEKNWTSPTVSLYYGTVKTATFEPEDEYANLPWETYENILWYFDEATGTLYFGGEGAIPELKSWKDYPWYTPNAVIYHLYIKDGITALNSNFVGAKYCDFYSVRLPATMTNFNAEPFRNFENLEAFTIGGANTAFYVKDGVLFCKNPSYLALACYPSGKTDSSYTVPEGVTRIPTFAMWSDFLEEIILPESMEKINNRAFSSERITSIHIPANVSSIGRLAFLAASGLETITVDEDNETYTSVDGVLFTKDMTMLHTYPHQHQTANYTVPDGVEQIPLDIITCGRGIRTLNLPSSLNSIYTGAISFNFYCTLETINVAADNPYFSSKDGVLFDKEQQTLLYYPIGKTDTTYRIPDSVVTIGANAFLRTEQMKTLYMGDNVAEVLNPIERCDNLREVYFAQGVPACLNDLFGDLSGQLTLYYLDGKEGWTEGTFTVDGVTYTTAKYGACDIPGDLTGDGKTDEGDIIDLANYFAGHADTAIEEVLKNQEIANQLSGFDENPEDFSRYDAMYLARALAGWEGYDLPEGFQSNTGN